MSQVDYGEDFLQRIVAVHWRKKGPRGAGGVFASGDSFGLLRASQDGFKWQPLGGLGFNDGETAGSVHGAILCGAYARSSGWPTFVLGGIMSVQTDVSTQVGKIMVSRDGFKWTEFYTGPIGSSVDSIYWDGSAFHASGLLVDAFTFGKSDWDELHLMKPSPPSDGIAGYDPDNKITVEPGDVSVLTRCNSVAYAGGTWAAGGGTGTVDGADKTSSTVASAGSKEGPVKWSVVSTGSLGMTVKRRVDSDEREDADTDITVILGAPNSDFGLDSANDPPPLTIS